MGPERFFIGIAPLRFGRRHFYDFDFISYTGNGAYAGCGGGLRDRTVGQSTSSDSDNPNPHYVSRASMNLIIIDYVRSLFLRKIAQVPPANTRAALALAAAMRSSTAEGGAVAAPPGAQLAASGGCGGRAARSLWQFSFWGWSVLAVSRTAERAGWLAAWAHVAPCPRL